MKSVYNCYKWIKVFPDVIVLADTKAFLFFSMVIQYHRALPQHKQGKKKEKKMSFLYTSTIFHACK